MSAHASGEANFFAALLNPTDVIAACERSPSLKALTSQKHSADRPGRKHTSELADWDAAVDGGKADTDGRRKHLVNHDDIVTAGFKLAEVCA